PAEKHGAMDYQKIFEEHMERFIGKPFYASEQITELLDLATPPSGETEKILKFLRYLPDVRNFVDMKGSDRTSRDKRQVLVRYSEARKRLGQSTYRDNPYKPGERPKL
ncbi:MAG TPA: hypothetical protein PKW28_16695, partial [Turneriella sp.]|nr:hypothetical protein [Turneriella sp.]